jgi:2-hydroxychromene-2-carboxylate isomerase
LRAPGGTGIFRPPALVTRAPVPVVIFADFDCPYSRVTEAALRRLEEAGEARVTPLAFELHPAPGPLPGEGATPAPGLAALERELGLPPAAAPPPVRTRKAHEAAVHAAAHGVGRAYRAAVYEARFAGRADVARVDVLVDLAVAAGLDRTETRVVLDVDTHAARVAAERAAALRAGVEGVPTLFAGEGEEARWWVGALPFGALRAWVLEGG